MNTKTNGDILFAEVGTLVDERVKNFHSSKTLIPSKKEKVLRAGFIIEKEVTGDVEQLLKSAEEKVKNYEIEKTNFATALDAIGVPYKTIIPAKLFKQLCREFSLIRFEHFTEAGEVFVSQDAISIQKRMKTATLLPLLVLSFTGIFSLIGYSVIGASWILVPVGLIGLTLGYFLYSQWVRSRGKDKNFVAWLFGELSEKKDKGISVLPVFPPLPEDLKPVMQKLEPLHNKGSLCTAALPDAVKIFTPDLMKKVEFEIEESHSTRVEKDMEERKRLNLLRAERIANSMSVWLEPIGYSYNQKESLTAVHYQFGDFPKEKEFMERLKNITDFELFNYL